jgi:hypothetical protein
MSRRLLLRRVASRGVLPRERFSPAGPSRKCRRLRVQSEMRLIADINHAPNKVKPPNHNHSASPPSTSALHFSLLHGCLCDRLVRNSSFGGRYKGSSRAVEWLQKYASMPRRGSQGSVRYATPL